MSVVLAQIEIEISSAIELRGTIEIFVVKTM